MLAERKQKRQLQGLLCALIPHGFGYFDDPVIRRQDGPSSPSLSKNRNLASQLAESCVKAFGKGGDTG